MAEHIDWDSMLSKVKLEDDMVGEIKPILKPCPFCGGKAEIVSTDRFVDVSCKHLWCRGYADSVMYNSEKEAIEAWNRRSDPDEPRN